MSLYRQLWLAILTSMLLALLGAMLASMLSARNYLESQLTLKNTDNAVALALSLSLNNPDSTIVELAAASLFDSGHYEWIRINDPNGKVVFERTASTESTGSPAWFGKLLALNPLPGEAQISSGWKQIGSVSLASQSSFAYQALWRSAIEMAVALALAGLLGCYLGALVIKRLRSPLDVLIDQAQSIMKRRFVSAPVPDVPELKPLSLAMNTTVSRLKAMFDDEAARLDALQTQTHSDALTGLSNRSHFMARLQQALESEEVSSGSLMLVRLGGLSALNQRLGRNTTDELLQQAAQVMKRHLSAWPDALIGRLNGADFAMLLPGTDLGKAAANTLLESLQALYSLVWIGLATLHPGRQVDALLARADGALTAAQSAGMSAVREAQTEDDALPKSGAQWSAALRLAVDSGWVKLAEFPLVNRRGELVHLECPVRLKLESGATWLVAGQFLPAAERLGLSSQIDLTSIGQGLALLSSRPEVPGIAINLSGHSLGDEAFTNSLLALLDQNTAVSHKLWLEISETSAFRHLAAFRQLCIVLQNYACRIGLEHCGFSLSQISALHDLGLDYLKVDASFIGSIDTHLGNQVFVKGLCGIARNIGMQVFAEGVHTQTELQALWDMGFEGATGPAIQTLGTGL